MNEAHKESLELLKIVHMICIEEKIKYTITADTLIAYDAGMNYDDCPPIIYISLLFCDFNKLKIRLEKLCRQNINYSLHDYKNTKQFDTFEAWFVKMPKFQLDKKRQDDRFYYGTRLIIVPMFTAGKTEDDYEKAYKLFFDTTNTVNARTVLRGKPIGSYIRLSPKRRASNRYIKMRGEFSIEDCINKYGNKSDGKYIVFPYLMDRNKKDSNSLPEMVREHIELTNEVLEDVEIINLWGQEAYCIRRKDILINMFPDYAIKEILNTKKSHLALNGNTYLWRVQQIQVELLREFDKICRKHDLRYNISFGTLLGAVRHKGFIPWDDDIDVTMPAEDFNRLDSVMREELDESKYYYRCPENEENNHLIFKHLERKGTVYTKPGRSKLKQEIGVFIDIFPMYPSAHFMVSDWIHAKICRYWRTALWATVGAESEASPKLRKKYERMAAPGNKRCYENFIRAATFFKNKKYLKFWIAMDRNPYKTALVRMSNYTDSIDIEFEGNLFKAPRDYEKVLDYCFGHDFMMYPSNRGRIASHNAMMNIGDLYLEESEN